VSTPPYGSPYPPDPSQSPYPPEYGAPGGYPPASAAPWDADPSSAPPAGYTVGGYPPAYETGYPQQQPSYPPAAGYPPAPTPGYPQPAYPQPTYPQPGYLQPGYPAPAPQNSRATWWILGAVGTVVAVAGVVTVLILALQPGTTPSPSPSGTTTATAAPAPKPADVIDKYLRAVQSQDRQTALDLYCRADLASASSSADRDDLAGVGVTVSSWTVNSTDEHGDTTDVSVTYTYTQGGKQQTKTTTIPLVKEDGRWKICFS